MRWSPDTDVDPFAAYRTALDVITEDHLATVRVILADRTREPGMLGELLRERRQEFHRRFHSEMEVIREQISLNPHSEDTPDRSMRTTPSAAPAE